MSEKKEIKQEKLENISGGNDSPIDSKSKKPYISRGGAIYNSPKPDISRGGAIYNSPKPDISRGGAIYNAPQPDAGIGGGTTDGNADIEITGNHAKL